MFEKVITDSLISPELQGRVHLYARVQRHLMSRRLLLVIMSFFFFLTQSVGLFSINSIPAGVHGSIETSRQEQFSNPLTVQETSPISSVIKSSLRLPFQPLFAVIAGVLFCLNFGLYFRSYLLYKELRIILHKLESA